ncbi:hypothetical protein [Nocardiopsis halotolerans]|uniref:hypothetical protein n=1 Tax=Nocardiopsis halotolerans TaxID=124252 RepID=UPI0003493F09|nr:hypothetical protein [Nocardiopsis halotolerans]
MDFVEAVSDVDAVLGGIGGDCLERSPRTPRPCGPHVDPPTPFEAERVAEAEAEARAEGLDAARRAPREAPGRGGGR